MQGDVRRRDAGRRRPAFRRRRPALCKKCDLNYAINVHINSRRIFSWQPIKRDDIIINLCYNYKPTYLRCKDVLQN